MSWPVDPGDNQGQPEESILKTRCGLQILAFALTLAGQTASFREGSLHGRRAFILENSQMQLSTLPGGGFIGEIRFKSSDPRMNVNPMRVPHYPTIDPYTYDIEKHGALYGTDIQRRLMSGYMGDFLCFPHFGPSSAAEFSLDLGQHGEAVAVEWKRDRVDSRADAVALVESADLPKTQFRVKRTITLPPDTTLGYIEESVENMAPFDRPMQWVHHVTFGPPFLELNKTFVDASASKSIGDADQRVFSGRTGTWLMDVSKPRVWFTIYNAEYRVLLGYVFESARNPWVLDWQENQRAKHKPWDGKVVARAVCIGDSPFAMGLQHAVARGSLSGVPVFSWIGARETKTQTYAFFLAEIPLGFKGVAELRLLEGQLVIVERETGKSISIRSPRPW
jgi:hypothetical protein